MTMRGRGHPTVFISYSRADEEFVVWLCHELEQRGIKYWLDAKEIKVGDSIVGGIERGIAKCEYFALCLSASSARSTWVTREYRAAVTRQLNSKTQMVRIVPLLIERCEIPSLLRDIRYADFSQNRSKGLSDLLVTFGRRFQDELPYLALIRHIETRAPLARFESSLGPNLEIHWAQEFFALLEKGVQDTKRELEAASATISLTRFAPGDEISWVRSTIPVVVSLPIVVSGGYEIGLWDDDIIPTIGCDSKPLDQFLACLERFRDTMLSRDLYVIPEAFIHRYETYPDGLGEWSVDLSALLKRLRAPF